MVEVKFKPEEPVRFYFEGRECTGIVDVHQRLSGFVLLRSNDSGHSWSTLHAIRDTVVWRPGEEPPELAVAQLEVALPSEAAETEPTAS